MNTIKGTCSRGYFEQSVQCFVKKGPGVSCGEGMSRVDAQNFKNNIEDTC